MAGPIMLQLTAENAEEYISALADVLCWFRGFMAAHHGRDTGPEMPPDWEALRSLNIKLKNATRPEIRT